MLDLRDTTGEKRRSLTLVHGNLDRACKLRYDSKTPFETRAVHGDYHQSNLMDLDKMGKSEVDFSRRCCANIGHLPAVCARDRPLSAQPIGGEFPPPYLWLAR